MLNPPRGEPTDEGGNLFDSQWVQSMKAMNAAHAQHKLHPPHTKWQMKLYDLIHHRAFDGTLAVVIILNILQMGCDYWGIWQDEDNQYYFDTSTQVPPPPAARHARGRLTHRHAAVHTPEPAIATDSAIAPRLGPNTSTPLRDAAGFPDYLLHRGDHQDHSRRLALL